MSERYESLDDYLRDTLGPDAVYFGVSSDEPEAEQTPLSGRWHHGAGVLVCGTIRVARADFDTNPPLEMQDEIFEWICKQLNAGRT